MPELPPTERRDTHTDKARRWRRGFQAGAAVAACALALGVGWAAVSQPNAYQPTKTVSPPGSYAAMPKPDTKGMNQKQIALVQRGEYLTTAGDCMPCHQAPGAKPFAGGLSFVTPFGTLFSPNISPDKKTGIGDWTEKQFWNALHNGISPGHSLVVFPNYIYPAMPYTSYAKLSRPDVDAIKAYLDAIPAIDAPHRANKLKFPFNIRAVLLGWRIPFFSTRSVHYDKSWSPSVRNGAYLAEALGHCGECHTPRNFLFAVKHGYSLAGAQILGEPWYAPNISSSKQYGVGRWSKAELVSYLHTGGNMQRGSAFGPMKSVVDYSLSQLPQSDIEDLAAYLQTATKPRGRQVAKRKTRPAEIAMGQTLYQQNCASCHQNNGEGIADVFPNLKANQAVWGGAPDNTIGIVLGGMIPWHANGPAMPAFGSILDDKKIAAITNYVRTAWGNPGIADATPGRVMALRETAPPHEIALADADYLDLPPIASAAARKLKCPMLSDASISPATGWMEIMRGATPTTIENRARMLTAAIRKSNPTISEAALIDDLMTAYCPVVATQPGLSSSAKQTALDRFRAQAQTLAAEPAAAQGS